MASLKHAPLRALPRRPAEAKPWGLVAVVGLALTILCLAMGYLSGVLGTSMLERPMVLLGLPVILALGFVFLIDRPKLLMALLLFRAALDPLLEATKINLGSFSTGIGGLLNALIIALTISVVLENRNPFFKRGLAFFAPFLLVTLVGVFRSPLPGDAVKSYLSLVTYFCAFIIGLHLASGPQGPRMPLKLIVASSVTPVLISLLMLATGWSFGVTAELESIPGSEGGRFAGPFTHPNILAFYMLLNIALVLYLWRTQPSNVSFWARVGPPLYMGVMVLILLLTKTRSAWAACFALFLAYGVFIERRFLLYLVAGLLLSTLLPSVRERLVDLNEGNSYVQYAKLNSYAWRQLIWSDGLSYMEPVRYVVGYGFESFKALSLTFFSMGGGRMFGAHNVYVQVIFEVGAIGLAALVWLMIGPLLSMWRAVLGRDLLAALGLLLMLSYAMVCYSDNVLSYLVFNVYFWLALGAIFVGLSQRNDAVASEAA